MVLVGLGLQKLNTAIFAHETHEEEERLVPEVTRHGGFLDPLGVHVPMDAAFFHIDHHLQDILALLEERKCLVIPFPVQTEVALSITKTAPIRNASSLVYISTHPLIPTLLSCEPDSHFIIPRAVTVHHNTNTPCPQRDFLPTDSLNPNFLLIFTDDLISCEAEMP